jgi:probable F420-dependent oxidoreductase
MPPVSLSVARFRDALRRLADIGFDSVAVSEHLSMGWWMEPLTALLVAALANSHLRLLSLVLANDFRHPVLLHKMAATIDMLSAGRLELGLGAGWIAEDYTAAGIAFDPPATRVARLAESVRVLKGLFGSEPFSFDGRYYQIRRLDGLPKPVQQPHPRLLIGGGGRKVLSLAAREADIVGVHCNLQSKALGPAAAADLAIERISEKVSWVRREAVAAGRTIDAIEFQLSVYLCEVTDSVSATQRATSVFADLLRADPALVASSPAVLSGTVQQCIEALRQRREQFGFSYIKLGGDSDAVAPIVSRLAGT